MTLLFVDGFSHYTDISDKWDYFTGSPTISSSGGRFDGDALQFNAFEPVYKFFSPGIVEIIVGFAFKPTATGGFAAEFLGLLNGDDGLHGALNWDSVNLCFDVYAGGTFRGTSSSWTLDEWKYVEYKLKVGDPSGAYDLRIDGVSEVSGTNVDAYSGGEALVSQVRIGNSSSPGTVVIDDLYIADTLGSDLTDFVGPVTIETLFPSGAGNTTGWTPSAGNNHENVDDTAPDGNTTYNSTSTSSTKDTFAFDNMTATAGTIHGVQVSMHARKQDAGLRELSDVVRHSSTDYDGDSFAVSQGYRTHSDVHETNPGTSSAWTISDVNGAEFGYKVQT